MTKTSVITVLIIAAVADIVLVVVVTIAWKCSELSKQAIYCNNLFLYYIYIDIYIDILELFTILLLPSLHILCAIGYSPFQGREGKHN